MAQQNTNRVNISGYVSRDGELMATTSGTPVLKFGIGNNERRKVQGEWQDHTNWVDVVMFGKRAEGISDFIRKGQRVAIDGKLSYRSWEDNEGQRHSKLEVRADEIELLGSKGTPQSTPQATQVAEVYDENIPF